MVIPSQPVLTLPATEVWKYEAPTAQKSRSRNMVPMLFVVAFLALLVGGGLVWLLMRPAGKPEPGSAKSSKGNANPTPQEQRADPQSSILQPGSTARSPLGIKATASSERAPDGGITYSAARVLDQSLGTAWDEGVSGPGIGEWIRCDFDREVKLGRIIITPGYFKTPTIWKQNNRLASATFYFSDGSSRRFTFPDQMIDQRLEIGGVRTGWVRMVIEDVYPGSVDREDSPISSLSFDWED